MVNVNVFSTKLNEDADCQTHCGAVARAALAGDAEARAEHVQHTPKGRGALYSRERTTAQDSAAPPSFPQRTAPSAHVRSRQVGGLRHRQQHQLPLLTCSSDQNVTSAEDMAPAAAQDLAASRGPLLQELPSFKSLVCLTEAKRRRPRRNTRGTPLCTRYSFPPSQNSG